jgi:hypothetical protein
MIRRNGQIKKVPKTVAKARKCQNIKVLNIYRPINKYNKPSFDTTYSDEDVQNEL